MGVARYSQLLPYFPAFTGLELHGLLSTLRLNERLAAVFFGKGERVTTAWFSKNTLVIYSDNDHEKDIEQKIYLNFTSFLTFVESKFTN